MPAGMRCFDLLVSRRERTRRLALGALLSLPAAAAAQTGDALAPFLGTWSGVFTTSENEFWGAEDLACFPGCPLDLYERIKALLADPANDERPYQELAAQANAYMLEQLDAASTPLGKQIRAENTPESDAKLHCQPYGFVREVTNPLPIDISRDGPHLLFRYEEWSLLRSVYMDSRAHPEHRTPSLLGHSVGRIEPETGALIVDTARVTPDRVSDFTQAGHSGELRAVERYVVHENPRRLELTLTLVDPVTLTKPYVITKTWLHTPDVELVEDRCAERPGKF